MLTENKIFKKSKKYISKLKFDKIKSGFCCFYKKKKLFRKLLVYTSLLLFLKQQFYTLSFSLS